MGRPRRDAPTALTWVPTPTPPRRPTRPYSPKAPPNTLDLAYRGRRGRIPPTAPPDTLDLAYRARRGCVRSEGTLAPDTSTCPTAADAAVFARRAHRQRTASCSPTAADAA